MTFRNHDPIIYLIGKISSINIQKKKKKTPENKKTNFDQDMCP